MDNYGAYRRDRLKEEEKYLELINFVKDNAVELKEAVGEFLENYRAKKEEAKQYKQLHRQLNPELYE